MFRDNEDAAAHHHLHNCAYHGDENGPYMIVDVIIKIEGAIGLNEDYDVPTKLAVKRSRKTGEWSYGFLKDFDYPHDLPEHERTPLRDAMVEEILSFEKNPELFDSFMQKQEV